MGSTIWRACFHIVPDRFTKIMQKEVLFYLIPRTETDKEVKISYTETIGKRKFTREIVIEVL